MPFQNENTFLTFQQEGTEDKFHAAFEDAIKTVNDSLGGIYPLIIDGEEVEAEESFDVNSPIDEDVVLGAFAKGNREHVNQAVAAAKDAFDTWRTTGYEERASLFEKVADIVAERKFELGATMTFENGKNRTEALADVDEAIDFLRFYAQELR
ncbi:MAG: aldehyde dehydrogenase family protein, partial [Candidatus Thermoplasmatota archaeon]|nr:aldehyde dehydrogenase family protein [Candidatus Thermoplasmatota archaeon]